MSANKNVNFLAVPYAVLELDGLTLSAKLVLAEILSLSKLEGHCYASNAYLAKRLRMSLTTVKVSIQSLKKHGYITSTTLRTGERFIYPLKAEFHPGGRLKNSRGEAENRPRSRAKTVHNNNIDNNKDNNSYKENRKNDYLYSDASYNLEELMKIQ